MPAANMTYRIRAIPSEDLAEVRRSGLGANGTAVVELLADGGEPLRCCLRNARTGEACILFGYEPPIPGKGSPYREVGAVFAHALPDDCEGPSVADEYPKDWYGRPQVLRAYDERGWIHPATRTHDGTDPVDALTRVLAEPGVAEVHSRNIAYGCYMFSARGRR
jgi:hypothetical protein